jgi:hypothetical protein
MTRASIAGEAVGDHWEPSCSRQGRPSAAYGSVDFDERLVGIADRGQLLLAYPADIQQLPIP